MNKSNPKGGVSGEKSAYEDDAEDNDQENMGGAHNGAVDDGADGVINEGT